MEILPDVCFCDEATPSPRDSICPEWECSTTFESDDDDDDDDVLYNLTFETLNKLEDASAVTSASHEGYSNEILNSKAEIKCARLDRLLQIEERGQRYKHELNLTESEMDRWLTRNVTELIFLSNIYPNLSSKIMNYIVPRFSHFHRKHNYFWLIPPDVVEDILRSPLLDQNSIDDVLETLFKWNECNEYPDYLPALLSLLDLSKASNDLQCKYPRVVKEIQFLSMQADNSSSSPVKLLKHVGCITETLLYFYPSAKYEDAAILGYQCCNGKQQVVDNIPVQFRDGMILVGVDGHIYFIEGKGSKQITKYSLALNAILSTGHLADPVFEGVAVEYQGLIYIVYKCSVGETTYRLQSYDPSTGKSVRLVSPNRCNHHASLFAVDEKLLLVGTGEAFPLSLERYNHQEDMWTILVTAYPFSYSWLHAAVCNNKLYLCSKRIPNIENKWLIYDFASEQWAEVPFQGGPDSITGIWTVSWQRKSALLLQDSFRLFYICEEVAAGQWTMPPEFDVAARNAHLRECPVIPALHRGPFNPTRIPISLGSPKVTVVCQERKFVVHQSVLTRASPVFKSMLTSYGFAEANSKRIELPIVTAESFERTLTYFHTERPLETISVEMEDLIQDLQASHFLHISGFYEFCTGKLIDSISIDNCEEMLTTAEFYGNRRLKDGVVTFLVINWFRTHDSECIKMNMQLLKSILQHPEMVKNTRLVNLSACIQKWTKVGKRSDQNSIIDLINLLQCECALTN